MQTAISSALNMQMQLCNRDGNQLPVVRNDLYTYYQDAIIVHLKTKNNAISVS